ncbi:MAG: hypothetical protein AMXMBFR52_17850 [Burkholderiales bacterium]
MPGIDEQLEDQHADGRPEKGVERLQVEELVARKRVAPQQRQVVRQGVISSANARMTGATRIARLSAFSSAMRFGTSSPRISVT